MARDKDSIPIHILPRYEPNALAAKLRDILSRLERLDSNANGS